MAWFFSGFDDEDEEDVFSESISLGDILGSIFGGGIFDSVFQSHSAVSPRLSQRESEFEEKIQIILGDNLDEINPQSPAYEAHKMRLYFELEDEILFSDLTEYEKGVKQYERENFCHTHNLCTKCFERLEDGICIYCCP